MEGNIAFARKKIPNWVFYIPFSYLFYVRLGTLPKLASWGLIYLFPVYYYGVSVGVSTYGPTTSLMLLSCLLIAIFSLYEMGYIINDTESVKKEALPTLRLYKRNLLFYSKYRASIYLTRSLVAIGSLAVLLLMAEKTVFTLLAVVCTLFVPLVFWGYNRCRNHKNVYLYPLLVCSRYIPFLLLMAATSWINYLLMLFVFPFEIALERFSMPTYRYRFMRLFIPSEEHKTSFRVYYYGITTYLLLYLFFMGKMALYLVVPFIVLFVYRLLLSIIVKIKRPKNYLGRFH